MSNPPFKITNRILTLHSQIHELLGEFKGVSIGKPLVKLRKENKIQTSIKFFEIAVTTIQ